MLIKFLNGLTAVAIGFGVLLFLGNGSSWQYAPVVFMILVTQTAVVALKQK